jgi:membrane protein DedA with SNARE-associated domain
MGSEALLKGFVAAVGFAFQLLDGGVEIINKRLLFRLPVVDNGAGFRIDSERRTATGTSDFDELIETSGHIEDSNASGSLTQMMESILQWISHYGYAGLFAALMLGIAGLPIPEETILVFCGYLISRGRLHWAPAFITGLCGSMCGISLSYFIGRTGGTVVVARYGKYVHLTAKRIERVHSWFRRTGEWALTFGYFILGVRHLTALVAGMSGLEFRVFARFAYPGAALWVATFLTIGYFVGDHWQAAMAVVHRYSLVVAAAVLLAALAWCFVVWRRMHVR